MTDVDAQREHSTRQDAEPRVLQFGRGAGREVAQACKETVAEAMLEDQSVTYFARNSLKHQLGMWRTMIGLSYTAAQSFSEAPLFLCTDDQQAAAICYLFPDQKISLGHYLRHGFLSMAGHLRLSRLFTAMKHQAALDKQMRSFSLQQSRFVHVYVLATRQDWRNRGRGSLLLRRICAEADARGLHCYLEASSERSRPLYMRHGYQDITLLRPEGSKPGAPAYWIMQRPPQPAREGKHLRDAAPTTQPAGGS